MQTADVVVIGGGIQGLSAAYQLAKMGAGRVLVIEKEFIGAGASGRSASMLMLQREGELKVTLSEVSYRAYMQFEDEFGSSPGFRRIGALTVAGEESVLPQLRNVKLLQERGIETQVLGPEDIRKLVPSLNTEDLLLGVYGPDDGTIDAHAIMGAFKEGAQRHGAEICQGRTHEATGITVEAGRVTGVQTPSGFISTRAVVNAAGAAAAEVAGWIGLALPISNRRRNIYITELFPAVPDDTPFVIDIDREWYFRKEGPGVLIGMGKEEAANAAMTLNADFLPFIIDYSVHRLPILERATIDRHKGWSGIRSLTPDDNPILGPVDSVQGYFNDCGWGGEGVMHAPAGGRIVAECVFEGRATTLDVSPFLASRFDRRGRPSGDGVG